MTNEQIFERMQELSKQIRELESQNRFEERNKLCVEWRELHQAYNWGFTAGQELHISQGKRSVPGKLLKCLPDNRFLVRYETGVEMIVSGFYLKHNAENPKEPEQLSLFEVIA